MNTSNKLTLAVALLAVAGAAISIKFFSVTPDAAPGNTPRREQAALTVNVTRLAPGTMPLYVAANGNIAAWQEAGVGAEANGLRLVEVMVDVGDQVRRGQLLARFAAETIEADLALRRASVAEAKVALAEAAGNAQRARSLQDSGALSMQHIQQQLAAEGASQARLDAALAAESFEKLRLAQTRVVAPDDGVISARSAAVGSVAATGQELFRLVRRNRLEWRAEVASSDLPRLKDAKAVRITLPDGGVVAGRLRQLAPLVDQQTRNGLAYVDVLPQGAGNDARPGMFARGEFELGSSRAMTLPLSAVQMREGFHYVFRVGADSRVVQTRVSVGRQAGDRIEIVAGLDTAAAVVASGAAFLGDNDVVRVVDDATTPGQHAS